VDAATDRISDLANENAQLGDRDVTNQALIDYQRRISEAAANVSRALGQCTDGQSQLIEALRNPGRYTPESVSTFAAEVERHCHAASTANASLQAELNR
ncbi:MAG: hypothetical protein LBB54_06310, partial [Cellulomonadaceae bacterium]|jgi:hypothetical protein|nr:hypothetical protein [Cellulomonadaceae bacterium]